AVLTLWRNRRPLSRISGQGGKRMFALEPSTLTPHQARPSSRCRQADIPLVQRWVQGHFRNVGSFVLDPLRGSRSVDAWRLQNDVLHSFRVFVSDARRKIAARSITKTQASVNPLRGPMKFTKQQLAAINHTTGNLQLIACAGSGKTEVVA